MPTHCRAASRPALRPVLWLGLALALAGPAAAADAAPELLAWRLVPGRELRYRFTSDQLSHQQLEGRQFTTRQLHSLVWTMRVQELEAPEGPAIVRLRYDAVKVELDLMSTGRLRWDSTDPEDLKRQKDPTIRPYAALVGGELGFAMRPDGSVLEGSLVGLAAIRERVLQELGDGPFARHTLGVALSDAAVRSELERAFRVLPPEPAAPGASWRHRVVRPVPVLGGLAFDQDFRLAAFEQGPAGRLARIELVSAIAPAPGALPPPEPTPQDAFLQALAVEFQGGGGQGEVLFSLDAGCLLRSTLRSRMKLASRIGEPVASADGPGATRVATEVEQTITVELLP
ncbi:MAG: hypothetical protein KatS3mg102_0593 [Planctomycetota bacterium]|nr:MAG: hypothetical protein KatS3mg102_0593 [Planctomycetota bacterium]